MDSRISALEEQIQVLLRSGRDIYSMEFDQVLVGQVVEQVKVINRSRIEIHFKSGWVESETLAADD